MVEFSTEGGLSEGISGGGSKFLEIISFQRGYTFRGGVPTGGIFCVFCWGIHSMGVFSGVERVNA